MTGMISLEGKLNKYTNVVKGWQSRFFRLNCQHGALEYHLSESEGNNVNLKPRGTLLLAGAVIAPSIDDEFTFSVNATNGEVYKLRATSTKERQEWVSHLRAVAHHFTAQIAQEHPPLAMNRKSRATSIKSQINSNLHKIKDQVQNLSTATITNTPVIHQKPSTTTEVSSTENNLAVDNSLSNSIRPRSDSQLSGGNHIMSIESKRSLPKTSVKVLQDVREMLVSADNYHAGLINMLESMHQHYDNYRQNQADASSVNSNEDVRNLPSFALDRDVLLIKATSSAMLQSLASSYGLLHKYHQNSISGLPQNASISWVKPSKPSSSPALHKKDEDCEKSVLSFEIPSLADSSDEVQDRFVEKEKELGPVDEHKNEIMELLTKVKLGMDLTKVTLPAFILEKRSLLEMYADFLGHADLFLLIANGSSPEERMCRLVKFYLSAFCNGIKGNTAKKPFNPIVGEVFQCSYYVPKHETASANSQISQDTHYKIKFFSEQVSHHPPVSAFAISCPECHIRFHSNIWTKSRFMNMSIVVNNIGEGVLSLSQYNEDYVMTYPSVYARSILTLPWSELGGRCTLICEKTGITATVTFHTKPTYGGQQDKVTVECKNRNGFVFCRADGKWNGIMEFTHYKSRDESETALEQELRSGSHYNCKHIVHCQDTDNIQKGHLERIDLTELPLYPKFVRPFEKQSRMESRKLWHHVTESLRHGDSATATKQKLVLENQQRGVEKKRLDAHDVILPNFFSVAKGKDFDVYLPNSSVI